MAAKKKNAAGKKAVAKRAPTNVADLPTRSLSPLDIKLDDENPRLAPDDRKSSQPKLLEVLIRQFKLEELAETNEARGYLAFDPVICWEERGTVTVREGNRRIAVLQLLLRPELAPPKFRQTWEALSKAAADVRSSLEQVRVVLASGPDDADVLAYMGFRHVSGVYQWFPFEKAAFIAHLIDDLEWSYKTVAQEIGSRADAVERHYVAFRLVHQARRAGIEGTESIYTSFGVLLRALNSPGCRNFIGVDYPGDPARSRTPAKKGKNVRDFVLWTFGTEEREPVLEDSRQLTEWGQILASAEALQYLRGTSSPRFERALFKAEGDAPAVREALAAAADRLEEAVPHVKRHKSAQDVKDLVDRCADYFTQILRYFPEVQDEQGIRLE